MSAGGESLSFIPSTSQPLRDKASGDKAPKEKLKVIVKADGSVVGKPGTKWSSRVGDFIKVYVPINYKEWRHVPNHFKDDVWNALMGEFEFNVSSEVARPLLMKAWPQKYRTYKSSLRLFLNSDDPFKNVPTGIDPNIWKEFVEMEIDPKKKQQNKKNSENRKKLEYSHTLGRCTYANKIYQKQEKEPEKEFNRTESWLLGHEHKDMSVLQSAKQKYDQLKEVQQKRKTVSSSVESSSNMYDIDNDEVAEVFGKDTKGRVRAVGSHISKKQLIHLGIANAQVEQMKKAIEEDVSNKALQFRLDGVENTLKCVLHLLSNMPKENAQHVTTTPTSNVGSNMVNPPPNLSTSLENVFATMGASQPSLPRLIPIDKSQVILCDKFGKHLAKGYIETNSRREVCHGKKVGRGEKIVYVEEVFVPDAIIWDSSETLAEYVQGGYLIWHECWLN